MNSLGGDTNTQLEHEGNRNSHSLLVKCKGIATLKDSLEVFYKAKDGMLQCCSPWCHKESDMTERQLN